MGANVSEQTSQGIQPYVDASGGGPLGMPEDAVPAGGGIKVGHLLAALKRRWLIVVLVWPLLAGPAAVAIWKFVKPKYTATAQVQVQPSLPRILYADEQTEMMPAFDGFLNTQAQIMTSEGVLREVLSEPQVKALPLFQADDPMTELREGVQAAVVPRTYVVQLNVTQSDPAAAKTLASAIMDRYRIKAGAAEDQQRKTRRDRLNSRKAELESELKAVQSLIQELAKKHQASSPTMFEVIRKSMVEGSLQIQQEWSRASLDVEQLQLRLNQLKQVSASAPASAPASLIDILPEENPAERVAAIERDPMVQVLRRRIESASLKLAQLVSVMTDEAREVARARTELEDLKKELDKELERASSDHERNRLEMAARMKDVAVAALERKLAQAKTLRDLLEERVKTANTQQLEVGQNDQAIQREKLNLDEVQKRYQEVTEEITKLETEKDRPGRISVISEAEVREEGIRDNRTKFIPAAVVGALFLACALAFLRDRLDPRIHTPYEVEEGTGLRLLGAVPSVHELKAGRVTEEDFAESYRLVRANLAGLGEDGSPPRSLLVTSAQACEGKTSLAVSLAASLAESGSRVLLIDGDIQAPQIGQVLNLATSHTLREVLLREQPLAKAVVHSRLPNLDVLVAGINGHSARGVLDSRSANRLLREAVKEYDHVVVDSPPSLGAADALAWAQAVDGVILSTFANFSNSRAMKIACQRLGMVQARLLGAVVCNTSIKESYYSYSSSSVRSTTSGTNAAAFKPGERRTPPFVQLPGVTAAESASSELSKST